MCTDLSTQSLDLVYHTYLSRAVFIFSCVAVGMWFCINVALWSCWCINPLRTVLLLKIWVDVLSS